MTDQAIVQWDANSGAALPAYLTDTASDLGSNIPDRMMVPSLSYEGKTWQIVKDGNRTKLQAQNSDGDMVPIPIMRAVILNFNSDRGRAYYPGTYNPSQTAQPDCWSADGKTPDSSSKAKQSTACNGCPMAVKGSKVQDGKEMVACGSHRMIAVAPAFEIEGDPLRLKIAVTSDYDKEVVEHGWFAFRQYVDFLKSRGVTHTALVVTKIKFDPNTAYPKLLFAIDRLLSAEEAAQMKRAIANPKVAELLAEKWSAAGVNGVDKNDSRPHGLEGAYADGWTAHPDAAGYSYKGQDVVANDELAARYPAPPPPPVEAAAPPPPPASSQVIDNTTSQPVTDPMTLARADGWIVHPSAPGYHYKGQDVVADAELAARYPAAAAPAPEPAAPPPPPAAPEPAAGTPMTPRERAINEGGWRDHPSAPGYMYLGQDVLLEAEVLAKFGDAPPPPAAPPAPAPEPAYDPIEAARADGWIVHPSAPGYHYKGQEVVADGDLAAKYPPAAAPSATAPAPAAPAVNGASPSSPAPSGSAEIPADVQNLLDKWSQ